MIRILLTAVCCCGVSALLGHFLLPVLRALKAGQSVRSIGPTWHNNKAGTPLMMGLMFIGGTLICLLVNLAIGMTDYTPFYVYALAFCFGAVGFLDDYCKVKKKRDMGLTAIQKSLLQMAVSAVFLYVLYREGVLTCDLYIPFWGVRFYIHPALFVLFAMFVIVGTVNAVNLTDGLDGLAGGTSMIAMLAMAAMAFLHGDVNLSIFCTACAGACLGFLWFNCYPASIFMGDTGSLALGAAFACTSIMTNTEVVSLIIGGLFIVETLSVMIQVVYFHFTHKRVFLMAPIHHHFEKKGWAETKVVIRFWIIAAAFGAVGLALFFQLG